ncbi:MAG: hypothetical protein COB02_14865 [Candidatus Cloacimonadota bacterium]|nr:MAG: hypothetical protein COB02_14865 [Candidatus Cloacimonadota bacterium]
MNPSTYEGKINIFYHSKKIKIMKKKGFTLTEILIALSILAFAFVPLMGVMWSGVRRTDVSASYENGGNIAASVLEFMLADSVKFSDIDFTNPQATGGIRSVDNAESSNVKESSGILSSSPLSADSTINSFLGESCSTNTDGKCTIANSKSRYFKVGRTNFYTDMYVGAYYENNPSPSTGKKDMEYRYYRNPSIDYEKYSDTGGQSVPQRFYDTMILENNLSKYNLSLFSPYQAGGGWSLAPSSYETSPKTDKQLSLKIIGNGPLTAIGNNAEYTNLAKIQIFVRWGYNWLNRIGTVASTGTVASARQIDSRGKAKMIELVTFKGRFE